MHYNNPVNNVDGVGLCIACTCLSVKTDPAGPKLGKMDFYRDKAGGIRFGHRITITFVVDGDPTKCTYILNEPYGGVVATTPDKKEHKSDGTFGLDAQLPSNPYTDDLGIEVREDGRYKIKVDLTQTYRCLNSDNSETMSPVTKHFTGSGNKKWRAPKPKH